MKEEWKEFLKNRNNLVYLEEVDSTNEEAKRRAAEGAVHQTVLLADKQSRGKGRRGRNWESQSGKNISMSILLRPAMEPSCASMLTIVAAVSVAEAVEEVIGESCLIKWPNDLVIRDKKICGILTEMSTNQQGIRYVIVGIGLNVNQEAFPKEIASMAASLRMITGKEISRSNLVTLILDHFGKNYEIFMQQLSLAPFQESYNKRLIHMGRQVKLLCGEKEEIRTSLGIDAEGALIVRDENGQTEKVISGEVSVRGLYGYVL